MQHSALKILVTFVIVILLQLPAAAAPQTSAVKVLSGSLPRVACVLIDSDANLDDLRAIAVIAPYIRIGAVITSDGILSAQQGAPVIAKFLASLSNTGAIPVLVGSGRSAMPASTPDFRWLAQTRMEAARLAPLLSAFSPVLSRRSAPRLGDIRTLVANATQDCPSLGLLMIGPWSSFQNYFPEISKRLKFVVVQGRSLFDLTPVDNLEWDRVNCKFDRDACAFAIGRLHAHTVYWIDLPNKGPTFPITQDMVEGLSTTPLALALKQLHDRDPAWKGQQQWDDLAALFIVRPSLFKRDGQHYLPRGDPGMMRTWERKAINGSLDSR
jgi:inosine-uridine nucleoside N-ribohydrolase